MLGYLPGFSDPQPYTDRLLAGSGNLAFDVGANAGWVAAKLAERYVEVVAFEPAKESYDVLLLACERYQNITPVNAAVSDQTGRVCLRETPITAKWGELVTGDSMPDWGPMTGMREVPAITLDDCLLAYGAPDLVKVDVEGHEVQVLGGATETVHDARPSWWIEVHAARHEYFLREWLEEARYDIEIVRHHGYVEHTPEWERHFYMIGLPR